MFVSESNSEFKSWFTAVSILTAHTVGYLQGAAYIKVCRKLPSGELDREGLPYCFIDRSDGTIYRSANWRFPSKKTPRGNIMDPDNGLDQMTPDGPAMRKVGCPKGFKYEYKRKSPPRKDRLSGEEKALPPLIRVPDSTTPMVKPTLPVRTFTQAGEDFWSKD